MSDFECNFDGHPLSFPKFLITSRLPTTITRDKNDDDDDDDGMRTRPATSLFLNFAISIWKTLISSRT